ncbi:MAG TPA: hypothetical protein VGB85_26705, partial [Nannocystis sp.]
MDRTHRARIALGLALALAGPAACGDPAPSGDGDSEHAGTGGAASSEPDPTTGASNPALTGESGEAGESGSGGAEGDDSGEDSGPAVPACDPEALPIGEREFIPRGESRSDVVLAPCSEDRWYFSAASESTVEVTLRRRDGGAVAAAIA